MIDYIIFKYTLLYIIKFVIYQINQIPKNNHQQSLDQSENKNQLKNTENNKQKMGNTSHSHLSLSQSDIKYVQTLEDQNFGTIDIYKNQEGKYIMMLKRTFMKDDKNQYKDFGFHQILNYVTTNSTTHSSSNNATNSRDVQQFITPILSTHTKIQNLCVVYEVIDTYCQYFNFTLEDMIKHKKQMDKEELWLTFYWMIKFAILLKQKGWVLQDGIKLNRIFLTLKGMPTVSIHHLMKLSAAGNSDQVFAKQKEQQVQNQNKQAYFRLAGKQHCFVQEIAFGVLQLACMTKLSEFDNLELFLRKAEKVDQYLGELLGSILRKSINKNLKKDKIDQKYLLNRIQMLLEEQKIALSKQIKLNKFRYIIPKPEVKSQVFTQQKQKQRKNTEPQKTQPLFQSTSKKSQKPIVINSLGRKNKQNLSLRGSNKRETLDLLDPKLFPIQTPMNKTMSIKNALLMDQIQNKKRETERQKQKMSQRKEMIMKSGPKSDKNKQNLLGNSIRQVRPSYNRKQSWTKKIINDHLKQSHRA